MYDRIVIIKCIEHLRRCKRCIIVLMIRI